MALEHLKRHSHTGVLQLDHPIVRCRRQQLAICQEGDGINLTQMALERLQ